ncbi:MAG: hypothetical protein ACOC32_00525 [Nanoarchaeota archaeon]
MVQHLKRLASPASWPISRKVNTWIQAPRGGHAYGFSVPLSQVMTGMLELAKTRKEVRYIIAEKGVKINGKDVSSEKASCGLFDVITFPATKQNFTIILNSRGKLVLHELSETEAKTKLASIIGKKYLAKKKVQLNLFGGLNITTDKDTYGVGDTLVLSVEDYKIKDHVKLEKGAMVYLMTGKNIAMTATVEAVDGSTVTCKTENNTFLVDKKALYVVGKGKPLLKLD